MGIGYLQILQKGISFVTATPVHGLGDRVMVDGNEYVYVHNRSSDKTALVGHAMMASSGTGYSLVISHVSAQDYPVGVVQHTDIPVNEYGWIMKKGYAKVVAGINTSLDANDYLILVATTNTGNISRKTLNSVASNEAFRIEAFGVVKVATGTAGVAQALINCP